MGRMFRRSGSGGTRFAVCSAFGRSRGCSLCHKRASRLACRVIAQSLATSTEPFRAGIGTCVAWENGTECGANTQPLDLPEDRSREEVEAAVAG